LTTPTTFRLPLESLNEGEAFVVTFSGESSVVVVVVYALAIKLVPIKKEEGETTSTKGRRRRRRRKDITSDSAIIAVGVTTTHILSLPMRIL
jgi:hypothetical protein